LSAPTSTFVSLSLAPRFLRTATANAAQLDAAGVARAMHAWMDDLFFHRLPRHSLWADADEDECEGTKEAVEKFIISKLPVKYACFCVCMLVFYAYFV
jgi:hypothetical protein